MFGGFARFHGPGHLDGAAKQQQLLGKGGLARIRMADDAKGTAALDFFLTFFFAQFIASWE